MQSALFYCCVDPELYHRLVEKCNPSLSVWCVWFSPSLLASVEACTPDCTHGASHGNPQVLTASDKAGGPHFGEPGCGSSMNPVFGELVKMLSTKASSPCGLILIFVEFKIYFSSFHGFVGTD